MAADWWPKQKLLVGELVKCMARWMLRAAGSETEFPYGERFFRHSFASYWEQPCIVLWSLRCADAPRYQRDPATHRIIHEPTPDFISYDEYLRGLDLRTVEWPDGVRVVSIDQIAGILGQPPSPNAVSLDKIIEAFLDYGAQVHHFTKGEDGLSPSRHTWTVPTVMLPAITALADIGLVRINHHQAIWEESASK
ncbi:MAG: hypothetical protein MRY64_01295 [Hyphomonadaceae bacterium]|nr:hypothetical protein [Hyphomonadaceae bacterium]